MDELLSVRVERETDLQKMRLCHKNVLNITCFCISSRFKTVCSIPDQVMALTQNLGSSEFKVSRDTFKSFLIVRT